MFKRRKTRFYTRGYSYGKRNFENFLFGDEGEFSRLCQSVLEEEKIKLNDLFKEYERRGLFFDRYSKEKIVDALKKIAETLDLSLKKLLKVAGYDEFLDYLSY